MTGQVRVTCQRPVHIMPTRIGAPISLYVRGRVPRGWVNEMVVPLSPGR